MREDLLSARNTRLPIDALASPFVRFANMEAGSGVLLLAGTIAALLWANSPWESSYHGLWNAQVPIGFGRFGARLGEGLGRPASRMRGPWIMSVKLIDAQLARLSAAAQREDLCLTAPNTMKG